MRASVRLGILALVASVFALLSSPALAATTCNMVDGLRTIQCALADSPDQPVHIVYIHGIRASAPGFSANFRETVCKYMAEGCPNVRPSRHYLNLGDRPKASYLGSKVWADEKTWKASRPFVEHYVYKRPNGQPTIIDEINYWPLLLALKCQYIIPPDARLAGPDTADIKTCAGHNTPRKHPWWRKPPPEPQEEPYLYAWIDGPTEKQLLETKPELGGSAYINKLLKTSILDWGISDAVIALGPMRTYTRLAVWCAFEEIEVFDPNAAPTNSDSEPHSCDAKKNDLKPSRQQFVVISESLGSFVLLDAFATATYYAKGSDATSSGAAADPDAPSPPSPQAAPEAPSGGEGSALRFIVERSDNIYFFANQFALLELARIERLYKPRFSSTDPSEPTAEAAPTDEAKGPIANTLRMWASVPGQSGRSKQLVAFNDPSDILTYWVPDFCKDTGDGKPCNATFRNIAVKNSFNWFGLFERPDYAHTYYSRNPKVLSVIFGTQAPARRPR